MSSLIRRIRRWPIIGCLGCCLLAIGDATAASTPALAVTSGEIGDAKFTIAQPAGWNRNVLLYAHGFRAEDEALDTGFAPTDEAYARLLAQGWMVAATSYRRNGVIVRDAIADLDALAVHIEQAAGPPALIVLLGESMGGAIVALIAERNPGRYHGAIAIDAALHVREPVDPLAPNHTPQIPLLFLANQSELAGLAAYVERAANAPVPPALWTIARDGHVNVNQAERTRALEGLITWITTNRIERFRDATIAAEPAASEIVFRDDAGHGRVREVTPGHGNLFTNFRPADFARLGIARGMDFTLEARGRTFVVRYGSDYGDVPRGAWVAFPRAEGVILLAINFGNAATAAGVQAGDPLLVRRRATP